MWGVHKSEVARQVRAWSIGHVAGMRRKVSGLSNRPCIDEHQYAGAVTP